MCNEERYYVISFVCMVAGASFLMITQKGWPSASKDAWVSDCSGSAVSVIHEINCP